MAKLKPLIPYGFIQVHDKLAVNKNKREILINIKKISSISQESDCREIQTEHNTTWNVTETYEEILGLICTEQGRGEN